ncbi:hypothetical protein Sya03_40710 [Spirilliplanes yamanashiensis]|uniref:Uncharacterized protein n=1 Tax=Spirilliplanes yamanashiensis TaxID=42233 RepID=A0A8J3YB93_9ACTN|nr:hypothetical protein Sya03_40710 [Spirilliplanes yamanashiensis]
MMPEVVPAVRVTAATAVPPPSRTRDAEAAARTVRFLGRFISQAFRWEGAATGGGGDARSGGGSAAARRFSADDSFRQEVTLRNDWPGLEAISPGSGRPVRGIQPFYSGVWAATSQLTTARHADESRPSRWVVMASIRSVTVMAAGPCRWGLVERLAQTFEGGWGWHVVGG